MKIISHRGNVTGIEKEKENTPDQIDYAISKNFEVEIDIWCINDELYLGHDFGKTKINFDWIESRSTNLWIHCKNIEAISYFSKLKKINFFWHESDKLTLTSLSIPWCYPGTYINNGITVLLNNTTNIKNIPKNILGICTDYPIYYKDIMNYA